MANYREAYGLFACSGILFNHESPLRPARFVTQKIVSTACRIAQGSAEKLVLGNLDIQRDWGWAPEYVDAMHRMLQQDQPEDYVIATGESHRLQDFLAAAFAALNLDWRNHVSTDLSLLRPTDIAIGRASPLKAKHQLNWQAKYRMQEVAQMMVQAQQQLPPQGEVWPTMG